MNRNFLVGLLGATPKPWRSPGSNVFRAFAWQDCGEDGWRIRRCIVDDATADATYGREVLRWPESDFEEAMTNVQLICAAPDMRDAILRLLDAAKVDTVDELFALLVEARE